MLYYDEKFYKKQKKGSLKSAKEVLPLVMEIINPKSVIDIGCGLGIWLSVFEELGVENILGLDGEWISNDKLYIGEEKFIKADLENPPKINRKFDLAMSLEVAEHLHEENAEKFVKYLVETSDFILFSAAIPFQGGENHINEQFQEYWIRIFEKYEFHPLDCLRSQIWDNGNVEWWYRQNIFLFAKKDVVEIINEKIGYTPIYSVVHPELFIPRVNTLEKELKEQIDGNLNKDLIFQNAKYKKKIANQKKIIKNMKSSNSWRVTKPLRALISFVKKLS